MTDIFVAKDNGEKQFFIGLFFGLALAYALYKIFSGKMGDKTRGYIIIVLCFFLYLVLHDLFGCGRPKYM